MSGGVTVSDMGSVDMVGGRVMQREKSEKKEEKRGEGRRRDGGREDLMSRGSGAEVRTYAAVSVPPDFW